MNLDDIHLSRRGARFALSCIIGCTVSIPLCILASVPIGLLSGVALVAFSSILLQVDDIADEGI